MIPRQQPAFDAPDVAVAPTGWLHRIAACPADAAGSQPRSIPNRIHGYLVGVALAALVTVVSCCALGSHVTWEPAIPMAFVVLAVAQIGVHLVFFLHLTTAPDNTNNIRVLAFGVPIVALIIGGSLWSMDNLTQNMMPLRQVIEAER